MGGKVRKEQVENGRYLAFMESVLDKAFDVYEKLHDGMEKTQFGNLLKKYLENNGYTFYIVAERVLHPKYKAMIRDDADGYIHSVKHAYLSDGYKDYLEDPAPRKKWPKNEYGFALQNSKAWNVMKNFPSYDAIHSRLVDKLFSKNIDLTVVDHMSVNDFRHFVKKNLSKEFAEYKKRKNVALDFIDYREFELFDLMEKNGYEKEQVQTLIDKMHKGELEGEILSKKGDNGKTIEFTKHHKEPVHNPHNVAKIYTINASKRIAMMEKKTHRWLHALESTYNDNGKTYYEKIMTPPYAAFVLNFEMCIQHDYDDPQKVFSKQDKKASNLTYLNKIDIMTGKMQRLLQNKNTKSEEGNGYVTSTGRGRNKGGRG